MKSVNFDFMAFKPGVGLFTLHLVVKLQEGSGSKLPIVPKDYMCRIPFVEDYDNVTSEDQANLKEVFDIELKENKLLVSLKPEKIADEWVFAHLVEI